jgi:uroporphyrinogen-III synthase
MSSKATLAGKTVVVTRPLAQAQNILELLEVRLATTVHFPVISISASSNLDAQDAANKHFRDLASFQVIIFISANAVHYAMSAAHALDIKFDNATLAAVGPATKAALEHYNYQVSIVPTSGFTSEALLNDPALQNIAQQNILIVRGEGGREHLRQTLESRDAKVDYAEVYQRQRPTTRNPIELNQLNSCNTAILLYSAESAQNLWSLCTPNEQQWLTTVTFIVGSTRIYEAVTTLGLAKDSIIAENPSDEAMLAALNRWAITAS